MQKILLACVFLTLLCILEVSPSPKRGGGSRGGGSRGSRGSSGSSGGGGSNLFYGGGRKPKGSKLTKAVVTGIGVFSAVQLAKLSAKFPNRYLGYKFDDWNDWREIEGFLCRNDQDCWVDTKMECVDYELQFTPSVSCTMKPNIFNLK